MRVFLMFLMIFLFEGLHGKRNIIFVDIGKDRIGAWSVKNSFGACCWKAPVSIHIEGPFIWLCRSEMPAR